MNWKEALAVAAIVGLITMFFDLGFHTFFTSPEEVPLYFLAKFTWGTLSALAVLSMPILTGAVLGGLVFDFLVVLYYGAASYTQNPALSCCFLSPPSVYGLPNTTWFVLYGYPVGPWAAAFLVVHFLAFFGAYLIVGWLRSD